MVISIDFLRIVMDSTAIEETKAIIGFEPAIENHRTIGSHWGWLMARFTDITTTLLSYF